MTKKQEEFILQLDFSEIETRACNFIIQAQSCEGLDVHTLNAMSIFQTGRSNITKEMRDYGKLDNFAKLYGGKAI